MIHPASTRDWVVASLMAGLVGGGIATLGWALRRGEQYTLEPVPDQVEDAIPEEVPEMETEAPPRPQVPVALETPEPEAAPG